MTDASPPPTEDHDSRDRIIETASLIMARCEKSTSAMVNQVIAKIREDKTFLGAILTPGVDIELKLRTEPVTEAKIRVLVADCVIQDRVETCDYLLRQAPEGWQAVKAHADEAKAEAEKIAAQAKAIREEAKTEPDGQPPTAPQIQLPPGLVRCPGCGRATRPLAECGNCGRQVGMKL